MDETGGWPLPPRFFNVTAAGLTILNIGLATACYNLAPASGLALLAGGGTMPVIWLIVSRLLVRARTKSEAWRRKLCGAGVAGGFAITVALASKLFAGMGGVSALL